MELSQLFKIRIKIKNKFGRANRVRLCVHPVVCCNACDVTQKEISRRALEALGGKARRKSCAETLGRNAGQSRFVPHG